MKDQHSRPKGLKHYPVSRPHLTSMHFHYRWHVESLLWYTVMLSIKGDVIIARPGSETRFVMWLFGGPQIHTNTSSLMSPLIFNYTGFLVVQSTTLVQNEHQFPGLGCVARGESLHFLKHGSYDSKEISIHTLVVIVCMHRFVLCLNSWPLNVQCKFILMFSTPHLFSV